MKLLFLPSQMSEERDTILSGFSISFINLYSLCFIQNNIRLRVRLIKLESSLPNGEWCVRGDFNKIKRFSKIKGARSNINHSKWAKLSDFIGDIDLVDLPIIGDKFSLFNQADDSASRLDYFLVSDGLIELWSLKGKFIGKKSFYDYCLISNKANRLNQGPNPFKFFSSQIKHIDLLHMVKDVWYGANIQGQKLFLFKEKLKHLKNRLILWNTEVFRKLDLQVNEVV